MNGNPKEKFEDKQNADWYNEGYTKGKVVYAYQMGVDDGSTGRSNQREFFADNLDSLQNYDRGRLRGINILASEDREKKTNRRNLLTNEDELKLYDKVYKEMASKFHHKDY